MSEFPYPATPTVTNPVVIAPISAADSISIINNAFTRTFAGITALAANYRLLNIEYLGAGRFVGATIDEDLQPVAGSGLTVRLPNATYLIEGRVFVVDEVDGYAVIADILPSKSAGVEVFVGINADTGVLETSDDWQFDTFPTGADLETVSGLLHIGTVVTDLTNVTSVTASTLDGYGIIRPRGTGGTGGGGGDVTTAQLDAAIAALRAQMLAAIAALEARVVTGTQPKQQPIEHLVHEHQITRSEVARNQETLRYIGSETLDAGQLAELIANGLVDRVSVIERSQSAVIGPDYGSGENDSPDFEGSGTLTKDPDGTFGV